MKIDMHPQYNPNESTVVIQKRPDTPATILLGRQGRARIFKNQVTAERFLQRVLHVADREFLLLDNNKQRERNL